MFVGGQEKSLAGVAMSEYEARTIGAVVWTIAAPGLGKRRKDRNAMT